jgi:uncharacterized protein (TIGR04255 family)
MSTLAHYAAVLGDRYPTRQDRFEVRASVALTPTVATRAEQRQLGYAFTSQAGVEIVQVRIDGFTFSRLHPYTSWDSFSAEARQLWDGVMWQ